ncbi:SIR2 family protein [Hydrogenoanaerobacterium sp.]|uniref:SIR2 family protein n=1 Tax=Hydrogenoanaerobacterium sp. TaxID=2953763 RepID=UPI002898D2CC|nr:SIR2 family protein [Hydrogenoanaerobacterium sp.]
MPDGKKLAKMIADNFLLPDVEEYSLTDVASYVEIKKNGRKELTNYIRRILADAIPDDSMKWIPSIRWKAIYTTNYDDTIQKAYNACKAPAQEYKTITHITEYDDFDNTHIVPIIHLHGSLFDGENIDNIIISQEDYVNYAQRRKSLFNLLQHCFVKNCVLFSGYSHNDPNFHTILADIAKEIYPNTIRKSYRIDPYTNDVNMAILANRNIETLKNSFSEFVTVAKSQLELRVALTITEKEAKSIIPQDFWSLLDSSIVPLNRFFNAWDYVNQPRLSGKTDIFNFVRGNKASWDIILQNKYFSRILEETLVYQMLEYATEKKDKVNVCTITGAAGYGITTLMMIIASKVVQEKLGQAFFMRDGKKLNEGDIFFAYENRLDDAKCFFFIDNAADHNNDINRIIKLSREQDKNVAFILGDRQNELASKGMLGKGDIHYIEPLCDIEIEALIGFLDSNQELNKLQYLQRDDQIASIRKNYNRELLVTIREATEGKSFDAIIQDEYHGINDPFSQEAYKLIACLHQFDVQVRMELLTSILDTELTDFYKRTKNYLKGVIIYDLYNAENSVYVARTRHRLIAQIVWDNCIMKSEKEVILNNILTKINITHYLDRKVFERLYRSDKLIDALPSLDSRMRFFNAACSIDPDNPYIRQHYARMLVRNEHDETALSTIEMAIKMDGSIRVLYHTKGYVLQQMAMRASTLEMGRKRVAQSEDAYQITMRLNDKDPYVYQGLGALYIDWAKKTDDINEETLYLSKAEDVLTTGLKKVYDKEAIWVELSKIDEYLDNTPGQIKKLKQAVALAPESPFANFLLGKTYSLHGEYDKAIKIFQPIFQSRPQEYRSSMEYAKAKVLKDNGSQESIREAIAILQQSTLNGYSDAYFIATLGGLLYLDKQFSESESVFQEARKREIQYISLPLFIPQKWNISSVFSANVKYVGGGYSFILLDGYSEVHCPYSKINEVIMKTGMSIRVNLKFNIKGPIAFAADE